MASVSPTAILACLFTFVVAFITIRWHRLRQIPGPPTAALSRWWTLSNTTNGNLHLELYEACKKYGCLVRIGPNELVTSSPEIVRKIWAVRSPYRRGLLYDALRFDPERDNLLSLRNEDAHVALKAKMAPGVAKMIHLIEDKYVSTSKDFRKLDIAKLSQYFTFDVISKVAFGESFGCLTTDCDIHQYIKMTEESVPVITIISVMPWIVKLLQSQLFKSLVPSSKQDKLGFGKFISVAKAIVAKRFGEDKVIKRDMLGSFIALGLTQEECGSETLLQIVAGSDTTATAIYAMLSHLITCPIAYRALQAEIDKGISSGSISSPITDSQARSLPYLQACIKEGLRIWPPVPGIMFKTVPPEGDTLNGIFVPGETQIGYCAWGVQRDKDIYGDDVECFRPERFLEVSGEKLK